MPFIMIIVIDFNSMCYNNHSSSVYGMEQTTFVTLSNLLRV